VALVLDTPALLALNGAPARAVPLPTAAGTWPLSGERVLLRGWHIRGGGAGSAWSGIVVSNPSAGADWSYTVTGSALALNTIGATLTTNSTAANRTPIFTIEDASGNIIWQGTNNANQTASSTGLYQATNNSQDGGGIANVRYVPLPIGLVVPVGGTIKTVTAGIQTTDAWTGITLGAASSAGYSALFYNGQSAAGPEIAGAFPSSTGDSDMSLGTTGIDCSGGLTVVLPDAISAGAVWVTFARELGYP